MPTSKVVICRKTGRLKAIYSDDLIAYIDSLRAEFGLPQEAVTIRRATNVEPDPERKEGGNWFVDLTPMGGPLVYVDEASCPFILRKAALDFERRWLDKNWLSGSTTEERKHAHVGS